jgi:hypothetical protein
MVPLPIVHKALEMSMNNQITQVMETLESSMGGLIFYAEKVVIG